MRALFPLFAFVLLLCPPAFAQVTVNLNALDALGPAGPVAATPKRTTPPHRHARARPHVAVVLPIPPEPPAQTQTQTVAVEKPGTPPPPVAQKTANAAVRPGRLPSPATPPRSPPAPIVPAAPPSVAVLGPVIPPAIAPTPPPPPPISATAPTTATPSATGLTVSFGAGNADLSAASDAAIKHLANSVHQTNATSFNVLAYAGGTPQDPSSARRLSLARALAVRGALMAAGVPSARVYVRALGEATGAGKPDRADITVMGANDPTSTAQANPGRPE